jgi:hypothetical protein
LQIIPLFGQEPITASNVTISVNPEDRARAEALVKRTQQFTYVSGDDMTYEDATAAAGELKAMLDDIQNSKKLAKGPFAAVEKAIDNLAAGLAGPVEKEHKRILALLAGHVAKLEAERKERERKEAEARRLALAEADRKVREAQEEAKKAQQALRSAQDEIERAKLKEEATRRENELLRQQLEQELAGDAAELEHMLELPPKGLVPGGRVNHDYEFTLVNVQATCEARCYRLLRWELDIPACKDSVKTQVELAPNVEPTLPGIKVTKKLSVSVKAAAGIRIKSTTAS